MAVSKSYSEMRLRANKHIQTWRKSGLSKIQYSRMNGIPTRTFFGWCKKYFLVPEKESVSRTPIVDLVPVPPGLLSAVQQPIRKHDRLSIHFGKHIRIVVTQEFSPSLLGRVIRTLEETR